MTESAAPRAERRARPRRPGPFPVVAASLALFLATFALLAFQLRAGRDPALGATKAAPLAKVARPVIVRRIHRRIVVTRIVHDPAPVAAPATTPAVGYAPAP